MRRSLYNTSQWHWLADRVSEGYKLYEVADFIGMRAVNVKYNMIRIGRYLPVEDRVPLEERKSEFYALATDESPINGIHPVIGTNLRTGEEVRYNTMADAARACGASPHSVRMSVKYGYRCKGYRWRKEEE